MRVVTLHSSLLTPKDQMITEERVTNLEKSLTRFIEQSSVILAAIHEDIAEIRASNARTDRQLLEMQQQAEKERKDFNKRLAELSDSMGTLIEDMVAPCGFQLARSIPGVFKSHHISGCRQRLSGSVRRRVPQPRKALWDRDGRRNHASRESGPILRSQE